jgi:hypothetical protein
MLAGVTAVVALSLAISMGGANTQHERANRDRNQCRNGLSDGCRCHIVSSHIVGIGALGFAATQLVVSILGIVLLFRGNVNNGKGRKLR